MTPQTKANPLVPPRPNLGPEPWADEPAGRGWTVAAGAGLAALAATAWLLARRRRKRRRIANDQMTNEQKNDAADGPGGRLAAWSGKARGALVERFGPAWGARTTEEIAADEGLAAALSAARFEGLVRLLREADRAKFAGVDGDQGEDWEDWVAAFVAELEAGAAGARSRIKGK